MHLSTQIERTSSPASIVFQFSLARGLGALTAAGVHPRHQTGCQGSNSSLKTLNSPKNHINIAHWLYPACYEAFKAGRAAVLIPPVL